MSVKRIEDARFRRKLCKMRCGRKARFRYRGVVKADRQHDLCFSCFRSSQDAFQARIRKEAA